MLGASAAAIGEDDEARRCEQFLRDSSPTAAAELAAEGTGRRFAVSRAPAHNRRSFPAIAGTIPAGYLPFLRVTSERKSPCRACACAGA